MTTKNFSLLAIAKAWLKNIGFGPDSAQLRKLTDGETKRLYLRSQKRRAKNRADANRRKHWGKPKRWLRSAPRH